jgi:hypothetical protein
MVSIAFSRGLIVICRKQYHHNKGALETELLLLTSLGLEIQLRPCSCSEELLWPWLSAPGVSGEQVGSLLNGKGTSLGGGGRQHQALLGFRG